MNRRLKTIGLSRFLASTGQATGGFIRNLNNTVRQKMKTAHESLLEVLEEAKSLVSRPENDFAWSTWKNREDALDEIKGYIAKVKMGDRSAYSDL